MSRYIDADALLNDLKEELEIDSPMLNEVENKWINKGIRVAIKNVKCFPTADVVEVVRCKDCKYFTYDNGGCCGKGVGLCFADEDQYCSYGERREE